MSSNGQPERTDDGAIAITRWDADRPWRWDSHVHDRHQLMWTPSGLLTIHVAGRQWLVPPTLGIWIPAGVPHAVVGERPAEVFGLYLEPSATEVQWVATTAVAATGLFRALITHLSDPELLPSARVRAEAVLGDALRPVAVHEIALAMPVDPRLHVIAERLLVEPADPWDLAEWGVEVGASVRTLARLFRAETGMTFAAWRRHARLRAAISLLADGASVGAAARRVGYSSSSSFIHAFHGTVGRTPGAYFTKLPPALQP